MLNSIYENLFAAKGFGFPANFGYCVGFCCCLQSDNDEVINHRNTAGEEGRHEKHTQQATNRYPSAVEPCSPCLAFASKNSKKSSFADPWLRLCRLKDSSTLHRAA